MLNNIYLPEGTIISTSENREYLSSICGLERAMNDGIILEAIATRCDSNFTLSVDLGTYTGYITRDEAVLTFDGEPVKDIAVITRVGKPVCFKVISIVRNDDGECEIFLSRRSAQQECLNNKLAKLVPGDVIPAKITHLEQFGAFVDIGCGIVSLLSIDCISVSRISHPKDRFSVGNRISCIVKKNDENGKRIYVTHKELLGTWEENVESFAIGQTVTGIVRSIEEYGIFVELKPNLAGLAEFKDGITVGQSVAVFIKNIIPERMKIKLVLIDTYGAENPTEKYELKYYIDTDTKHITKWVYSPTESNKVIETAFE
ncbi:MAG: S1 RNA-binding domain-containing protein [Clostridia bacterium]|nr:S1 RNA-binding domain-containing protein [Clostridia bacterium]